MQLIKRIFKQSDNKVYYNLNSFSELIKKYLNIELKNITFIDVGANRGTFYNELTSVFDKAKIEALLIEPIPECVKVLESKFAKYGNVQISQVAVSDRVETRNFFINQFDETSSLLKIKNGIKELKQVNTKQDYILKLTTNTLDKLVLEQNFNYKKIDLVKIDVQGYEDKVLLGAKETLSKTEFIWIEVSFKSLYDGTCLFGDIYTLLNELNFILLEISDGHRSPDNELLQANCLFRNINLI